MVYFFENNFNIKSKKEGTKKASPKGDASHLLFRLHDLVAAILCDL